MTPYFRVVKPKALAVTVVTWASCRFVVDVSPQTQTDASSPEWPCDILPHGFVSSVNVQTEVTLLTTCLLFRRWSNRISSGVKHFCHISCTMGACMMWRVVAVPPPTHTLEARDQFCFFVSKYRFRVGPSVRGSGWSGLCSHRSDRTVSRLRLRGVTFKLLTLIKTDADSPTVTNIPGQVMLFGPTVSDNRVRVHPDPTRSSQSWNFISWFNNRLEQKPPFFF